MTRAWEVVVLAGLAVSASSAFALGPPEVFEKAAPSVLAVRALDGQGKPLSFGSAVVIGPGKLVTSCHVLSKAGKIELIRDGATLEAALEQADVERDLCVVSSPGLAAPAAAVAAQPPKIGQRLYAVGAPARLDVSLAEGMVSGTRSADPGLPSLQISVPLSPGLGGGGLFDEQAQLVGIAILDVPRGGIPASINFAQPAASIAEIGPRSAQQLAERRRRAPAASQAQSADGMPAPGTRWRYSYRDQQYGRAQTIYTVELMGIDGASVRERFAVEGGRIYEQSVDKDPFRFIVRPVSDSASVLELAPYAPALYKRISEVPAGYTAGIPLFWEVHQPVYREERVTVPAGTFPALRVEVAGTSSNLVGSAATRFVYTAWYVQEMKRYVKIRHQTWSRYNAVGDEVVQLLEYRSSESAQRPAGTTQSGITTLDLEPIGAAPAAAAVAAPATLAAPRPKGVALKAIVLNLSGASDASGSEDWAKFQAECTKQFSTSAEKRGAKFSTQEGEPRALKEPGTLVAVYINDFRYVSPGARAAGGIMVGKATVEAKVRIIDLQTGAQISEKNYASSSADLPGFGIFAAASNKVLEDVAERILGDLENR